MDNNMDTGDIFSLYDINASRISGRSAVNANVSQTSLAVSNQTYGALILEPTIQGRIRDNSYEDVRDISVPNIKGEPNKNATERFDDTSPTSCKAKSHTGYVNSIVNINENTERPASNTSTLSTLLSDETKPPDSCQQDLTGIKYINLPSLPSDEGSNTQVFDTNQGVNLVNSVAEDGIVKAPLIRLSTGENVTNSLPFNGASTIGSQLCDMDISNDDDDFWLNLAKGQTIGPGDRTDMASSNQNNMNTINELETDYEFIGQNILQGAPRNIGRRSTTRYNILDIPSPQASFSRTSENRMDLSIQNSQEQDNQFDENPVNVDESTSSEPIYELAKPIKNEEYETENNKNGDYVYLDPTLYNTNDLKTDVRPKQLVRKYKSVTFRKQRPIAMTFDDFKTASLDRRNHLHEMQGDNPSNRESQLYESVDNLSIRDPLPTPHGLSYQQKNTYDERYVNVNSNNAGKKIKVYDPPWKTYNSEIEKIFTQRPPSGLGLDHIYARVNKPKRYENFPRTHSMERKINNASYSSDLRQSLIYEEVTSGMGDNDFFRELDESRKQSNASYASGLYSTIDDSHLVQNPTASGQNSSKGLKERSSFNPLSFIFHFQVDIVGQSKVSVKKIQEKSEGKCWLLCTNDLKIRLFDPQGIELESIDLGDEGETIAYDLQRYLFVSCKNSKRIFRIDTKQLCQVSVLVDCESIPTALSYDPFDESLIVCDPTERASRTCVKRYTSGSTSQQKNFRQDESFSHPSKACVSLNSDIVISDAGTKSLTILEQSGGVKSRFTGNDEIRLSSTFTFACDKQGNVLVVTQCPDTDEDGNLCLLDENGHFIDTCIVNEINGLKVTDMAITDVGFVWISSEAGVYLFDYQFA